MHQSVNLYEAKTQLSGLVERASPNLPLSAHFSSINAGLRIDPDLAPKAQSIDRKNSLIWRKIENDEAIGVAGWGEVIKALGNGTADCEPETPEQLQVERELVKGWFGLYYDAWRRNRRSPIWLHATSTSARRRSPSARGIGAKETGRFGTEPAGHI
jgi:hypothetical protein